MHYFLYFGFSVYHLGALRDTLADINRGRKIFHVNIFYRSVTTWILRAFFIKKQGCYTFLCVAVSWEKKKPIRRDAVWSKRGE